MMIAGTERRRQGCSLQDGKQWGASGYAVTFPIAFNVVYNVLSIPQTTASTSNAYWGRFYITALTKNGFNVSDTGAGSNRWIAIGSAQPQWGTNRTNGIYSFPIPFTEALCCFGGGEAGSGYYDNASAYSNTQVRVYSDGSSRFVSWIAIGA